MKLSFDISKTLIGRSKKIFWILGVHAFLLILLLVFIDFILGAVVFYKFVFLAQTQEIKITESAIKFDVKTYQRVTAELQARKQKSEESFSGSSDFLNTIDKP